jgi:hypothetical protein
MSSPSEMTHKSLAALLSAAGHEVTPDQIAAILEFLKQVGSVEKGQEALAVVEELKRAA